MERIIREPFDPSKDFEAAKAFRCGGLDFVMGQPFDKYSLEERKLKQLYDHRFLRQVEKGPTVVARPKVEPPPTPTKASDPAPRTAPLKRVQIKPRASRSKAA